MNDASDDAWWVSVVNCQYISSQTMLSLKCRARDWNWLHENSLWRHCCVQLPSLITVHCPLQSQSTRAWITSEASCGILALSSEGQGHVLKVRVGEHPSLYGLISNITSLNLLLIRILWRCIQIAVYHTTGLWWSDVWSSEINAPGHKLCAKRALMSFSACEDTALKDCPSVRASICL